MLRYLCAAPLFVGVLFAASCGTSDTPPGSGSSSSGKPGGKTGGTLGSVVLVDGTVEPGNFRSCTGGTGADKKCGGKEGAEDSLGSEDCCEAREVPGGTFNRFNDKDFPATVSKFKLDTFLVTVGRFRAFVEATKGNIQSAAPPEGGGAHPKIKNSGWRTEWNRFLPSSIDEVNRMLGPEDDPNGFLACQFGTDIDSEGALTWWTPDLDKQIKDRNKGKAKILSENTQEALDRKPLNCVPWHVMFAFCYWDGGRLPTEAEFDFATSGGDEQRQFSWGNVDPKNTAHIANRQDLSLVPIYDYGEKYVAARLYDKLLGPNVFEDNYSFTWGGRHTGESDNAAHMMPVGRRPAGNAKWGHADLTGGIFEWLLDEGPIVPGECKDCANVNWPGVEDRDPKAYMGQPEFENKTEGGIDWWKGGARAIRGSAWDNANGFSNHQSKAEVEYYTSYPVLRTYRSLGGRCARD